MFTRISLTATVSPLHTIRRRLHEKDMIITRKREKGGRGGGVFSTKIWPEDPAEFFPFGVLGFFAQELADNKLYSAILLAKVPEIGITAPV